MSTFSARIHVAKMEHQCDDCYNSIKIGEYYMKLYGNAYRLDPPNTYHIHLKCLIGTKPDEKILEAFRKSGLMYKLDPSECFTVIQLAHEVETDATNSTR